MPPWPSRGGCGNRPCFPNPSIITQASSLREIVETWDESSGSFLPLPDRRRGPKGDPGERGPPGKEVSVSHSVGVPCGQCHHTSSNIHSSFPPGPHWLFWRTWTEGRSWRPWPSGATGPGPWGKGPPWTSRPCRGAWKAWYSWAPRPGWGRRRGRKARREGELG